MINTVYIDVDTTREANKIALSKPEGTPPPETKEEAAKMILDDIICISQALKNLILMAHANNIFNREELVPACIETINEALTEELIADEPTTEEPNTEK